jgi:hypothetical protein
VHVVAWGLWLFVAACGRIGFDSNSDGGVGGGDGALGDGTGMESTTPGAATLFYVGSAALETNLVTYTFNAQNIGPPSADRIVVVCAFLGGAATTDITSITVGGVPLSLTAVHADSTSGAVATGYKTIPNGAVANVTVTSGGAGRAAIAVYNVTASAETPAGSGQASDSFANANPLNMLFVVPADGVVIANAGYGSNNVSWLWSGTWTGYAEYLDSLWSEQGSYTTAGAATSMGGFKMITATPSNATSKYITATAWR